MESTDAELVACAPPGDVDAFEALYRLHASRIYALARRMSRSPEAGEDHSMRATFGDASATLTIRTFSGDIVIAKGK